MSDRNGGSETKGGPVRAESGDSLKVDTPQRVLSLLQAQATLYAELEACAIRQRALIEQDDVKPLLTLLGDRRRITDTLTEVSEKLRPVRKQWDEFRASLTPGERDQVERLLGEVEERVRRLMDQDETDTRLLAAKKQFTARALGAVHAKSQAISAYQVSNDQATRPHSLQEES
jgi:hypothetical protein